MKGCMHEIVYWYLIFALSGGFVSILELFIPIVAKLSDLGKEHIFVTNPIISGIVWYVISVLAVPFIVIPLLFTSAKDSFINEVTTG